MQVEMYTAKWEFLVSYSKK